MLRSYIGNALVQMGRKTARSDGSELLVEVSDHSIRTRMVRPDTDDRAWDSSMYKHGNLFVAGYANPIKPSVDYRTELEDPDTVNVEESSQNGSEDHTDDADGDGEDSGDTHVELISSPRYREYMRQDLISQLLNPREQWRLLAYGIIALAGLLFFNMIITMWATGTF